MPVDDADLLQLRCEHCAWREICDPQRQVSYLRSLGMLRRDPDPDPELVRQLLYGARESIRCPQCRRSGPLILDYDGSGDWPAAPSCEVCGQVLSEQRLAALPQTRRCRDCQAAAESAQD